MAFEYTKSGIQSQARTIVWELSEIVFWSLSMFRARKMEGKSAKDKEKKQQYIDELHYRMLPSKSKGRKYFKKKEVGKCFKCFLIL